MRYSEVDTTIIYIIYNYYIYKSIIQKGVPKIVIFPVWKFKNKTNVGNGNHSGNCTLTTVPPTPNYVRQFMKILDQVTVFNFMVV